MEKVIISVVVAITLYAAIGTGTRVEKIKEMAPADIAQRGWEIVRYEGYQLGSFCNHGGKVWYHVRQKDEPTKQYRVYITLWAGELHYTYGEPEVKKVVTVDHRRCQSAWRGRKWK